MTAPTVTTQSKKGPVRKRGACPCASSLLRFAGFGEMEKVSPSECDHAPQSLASLQGFIGFIDLGEGVTPGQQFIQLQLARPV